MIVKLLTEHHLEFLSLKGGCRGSSESTNVKMPHCWKSRALAQMTITDSPAWRAGKSVLACDGVCAHQHCEMIPFFNQIFHISQ